MLICLTGMMGCGKSSTGLELARRLGVPFFDLDSVIEHRAGRSIPEIFRTDGEPAFRALEMETLQNLLDRFGEGVLALGGGTVMTPAAAELIRNGTCCIYLKAGPDALCRRLSAGRQAERRPLLASDRQEMPLRQRIEQLLTLRDPVYADVARHVIETDRLSPAEAAEEIRKALSPR